MQQRDRNGERVARIRSERADARAEHRADHVRDLVLARAATPRDGLLHLGRREFAERELATPDRRDERAARLTEHDERTRVHPVEHRLDADAVGPATIDRRGHLLVQRGEADLERVPAAGRDRAGFDEFESRTVLSHEPPPGTPRAGIDAESEHGPECYSPRMSRPTAGLVLVAAGTGTRLGAAVHKALVELDGQPLVLYTLTRLLSAAWLDPIVLVGHPDDREALRRVLHAVPRPVRLVDGGERRQDSVLAGLEALDDGNNPAPDVALVHDAARPFPPIERLGDLAEQAQRHGGAIYSVPVADTIKARRADEPDLVDRTVPRAPLMASQTPQAFRTRAIVGLLQDARDQGQDVTDEAMLVETTPGLAVAFVEGSRRNFKVTTPDDLFLARRLAAEEKRTAPA